MQHHDHQQCISKAMEIAQSKADHAKKRLTDNRLKVLKILLQSHKAIGAYEVLDTLNADSGQVKKVQPPTVYRALDFLLELGLIHKLESQNQYFACLSEDVHQQDHLITAFICDECGNVSESVADKNVSYIEQISDEIGFKIKKMVMECHGICQTCSA